MILQLPKLLFLIQSLNLQLNQIFTLKELFNFKIK